MISPIRSQDAALVPPLRDGDLLTMEEFERRWDAMPNLKRAELINGRVYMNAAALRWDWHSEPHGIVLLVLTNYSALTPGVPVGPAPSVRMGATSMPQPDAVLRIIEECGGSSRIQAGYVVGGPEFVAEISASAERLDLHDKKELYMRSGVQEYLNWSVLDERIVLFSLESGSYVEVAPDGDGILKSRVMPGLWFAPTAMIQGERSQILDVLQKGLQSPEHAAFVESLRRAKAQSEANP